MKKILLLILFSFCSYFAQAQYIVEGRGTYTVNQVFLRDLSNHIMRQPQEIRPFLNEIYYALKEGKTVKFNPLENTISGVSFSKLFTREEIYKEREKYRRNPNRGARKNTKYHRLCVAVSSLNSFYPSNSKY